MTTTQKIGPAKPMTLAEHEFLIDDGSMAGAVAEHQLRFVYCDCGRAVRADEWHEHLRAYAGARAEDDNGPHNAWGFERTPDWINDFVVLIDGPVR